MPLLVERGTIGTSHASLESGYPLLYLVFVHLCWYCWHQTCILALCPEHIVLVQTHVKYVWKVFGVVVTYAIRQVHVCRFRTFTSFQIPSVRCVDFVLCCCCTVGRAASRSFPGRAFSSSKCHVVRSMQSVFCSSALRSFRRIIDYFIWRGWVNKEYGYL